ncbi:alpha/beta hydrolase [Paenibacillus thiaminolyticus]|uniref:alpha/beta fold hydrolase n=1 Tax=Paenibacillus thiaminolyticus TaxID=49283 RepID=UPI003D2CC0DA
MKNRLNREIFFTEYASINGIDQFLFHSGASCGNPVMLFLHGGPGAAKSLFTRVFQEKWEEIYTVVHWDQRGTGKTLTRNPDKLPSIDLMLQDLFEVIQYLKRQYNMQKIVLFGHSWGSVLGSVFIKQHPEDVAYYIGAAQVVNMLHNEQVGYNKVKELIERAGDKKSLKKLEKIGEYPGGKIVFDRAFLQKCEAVRKLQGQYNLALKIDLAIWLAAVTSPIFQLSDISSFKKAFQANQKVLDYLADFDLTSESSEYQVPVYYVLGERDWQAPFIIAEKYFAEITAPDKNLYIIPGAGHSLMMDQPQLCFEALADIHGRGTQKK